MPQIRKYGKAKPILLDADIEPAFNSADNPKLVWMRSKMGAVGDIIEKP
jgi:hypothetical protein